VASTAEIAQTEGIDVTPVRRLLRLTLPAPEAIERLIGTPGMVLELVIRRPWPSSWVEQVKHLAISA